MLDYLPDEKSPAIIILTASELDELVHDDSLEAYCEDWLSEQLVSHYPIGVSYRIVSVCHSDKDSTGRKEHYVVLQVWALDYGDWRINHMTENLPDQENPAILTLTIDELDELVQDCSLQAYIENWLDEQLLSHNACDTQFKLVSVEHSNVDSMGRREHYVIIHVWANSYEFYGGLTDEDNYYEVSDNV